MYENILVTKNLCKKYGKSYAVKNLNIRIKKGDIYGLVGKNGAGKTSLMKMILSMSKITDGEIELFGAIAEKDRVQKHVKIGAMIETPAFYPYLSAKDNLEYYRIQRGIPGKKCVEEALETVGLSDIGKKKFKSFSLGMKQRLGIALAIMGSPDFLVLDEPINGLDPTGIKEIRDLLLSLNKLKGITILISSHMLGELSQLATCYGFIHNGKLIEEVTVEELEDKCKHYLSIKVDNTEKAATILEEDLKCMEYEVLNANYIRVYKYLEEPEVVSRALFTGGIMISSLERIGSNLEEYFLNLIGGKNND